METWISFLISLSRSFLPLARDIFFEKVLGGGRKKIKLLEAMLRLWCIFGVLN